jgi:hypothetical protein
LAAGLRRAARGMRLGDRGVAALEGLLVVAMLAGFFCACLLLSSWGTSLQSAQMGARLLAFNAGNVNLAKVGKPLSQPTQQFASQNWVLLFNSPTASWLGNMFTLRDSNVTGNDLGTAKGRLPGQASLFSYPPATMGCNAHGWAGISDPWGMPESVAQSTYLRIAYHVGLNRTTPSGLDSTSARAIPHGDTCLETIYHKVGQ